MQGQTSSDETKEKFLIKECDCRKPKPGLLNKAFEKYNIDKAPIAPKSDRVVKKYGTQVVATDTGVELKIPMDQYEDANAIEFIQEEDGRLTIVIKNIGSIVAR